MNIANVQSLPSVFTPVDYSDPSSGLLIRKHPGRWAEFIAHVSQFSESGIEESRRYLELLQQEETNMERRSILLAGLGRCQIHSGHLIEGAQTLGQAYSVTAEGDRESRAFILMEMASFMAITGQYDLAIMLLDKTRGMTRSEYLCRLAEYYHLVVKSRQGDEKSLEPLHQSAVYFEQIGEWATLAYHAKNIGNGYRRKKQYSQAGEYYGRALDIARQNGYAHIESAVLNDLGLLHYHSGNPQQALDTLASAVNAADSDYTRCFILGTIGFIHRQSGHTDLSIQPLQQSFELALQNSYLFLIPSLSFHLADCHRKRSETSAMAYYLKTGSTAARELLVHHFPYSGYRKQVMEQFTEYLSSTVNAAHVPDDLPDLSFTLDRSLEEIRSLFQGNILGMMKDTLPSLDDVLQELDIPRRTYYEILKRTGSMNSRERIPAVEDFYRRNNTLNWKDLNRHFEREVCTFLLAHLGSKKALGEQLQVSYPHIMKLTTGLSSGSPGRNINRGQEIEKISLSYKQIDRDGNLMPVSKGLLELAREFRKNPTPEENVLWQKLRNRQLGGSKFNRQHPFGGYILDFYCAQKKLAVELDGSIHRIPTVKENDIDRQAFLEDNGLTVLRFDNKEVHNDLDGVLRKILRQLNDDAS